MDGLHSWGLSVAPFVALALAITIARRAPLHRPIVIALGLAKGIALARPHLAPRADLALLLALPALSAWATLRALRWVRSGWPCLFLWVVAAAAVLLLPGPAVWWPGAWPVALGASAIVQAGAWWRWRREGGTAGITQRVAAVLAWGDAAGFAVGMAQGWDRIGWQGGGVAVVVCVVQALWLADQRGGGCSGGSEGVNPMRREGGGWLAS